jgi:hypothetical protein
VTIRAEVVLVCDARRVPGGHGRDALVLGGGVLPGAGARVRPEAQSPGGPRESGGKDACPARRVAPGSSRSPAER